eukprot:GHVQ01038803.1.p1 GENE.GHVQ01038803.1~~GHVQ01038803.1.p1  ORF type:complete len:2600 (-),score=237.12 GHVQ01038803.1:389-8188(-)
MCNVGAHYVTGTSTFMSANRLSYVFDLRGPSVVAESACSAGLTAMHLAVAAVANCDCDQALIAGVHVLINPVKLIGGSKAGVLSPEGISRPFDAGSNGFVRSEGAVALFLKRLDDAIGAGDHIYAVIRGSALNSSGGGPSLTYPSASQQSELINKAFERAHVHPNDVACAELHATSTSVGDPIECNAFGSVIGAHRDETLPPVLVGSVKSNIGHLEEAAGLAGLAKMALMLDRGVLVPSINVVTPNPRIHWARNRMEIATKTMPLHSCSSDGLVTGCVSSYGIGGSNTHAVLQQYSPATKPVDDLISDTGVTVVQLYGVGALSSIATSKRAEEFKETEDGTELTTSDQISMWSIRRTQIYPWRSFAVSKDCQGVVPNFREPMLVPSPVPPICFVFSGQGPEHMLMGKGLYARFARFRESILESDVILQRLSSGTSFVEKYGLFSNALTGSSAEVPESDWPMTKKIVSTVVLQIALFDLWTSLLSNRDPVALVGHSVGEISMMYASGAVSRWAALKIALGRAAAMSLVDGVGGMAALGCDADTAQAMIDSLAKSRSSEVHVELRLWIAAYNSPVSVTIAGDVDAVEAVVNSAKAAGLFGRILRVGSAFHTVMMESCKAHYMSVLNDVFACEETNFRPPQVPVLSSVTGKRWPQDAAFDVEYCWRNLRQPVLFSSCILDSNLIENKCVFVEMSAHPVLTANLIQIGADSDRVLASLRRSARDTAAADSLEAEVTCFLNTAGVCLCMGYNLDTRCLTNSVDRILTALPTKPYPYQRRHIWNENRTGLYNRLLYARQNPLTDRRLRVSLESHAWLADHAVDGAVVMPAAAYIIAALGLPGGIRVLDDVSFPRVLTIGNDERATVEVDMDVQSRHWWVKTSEQLQSSAGIDPTAAVFDTVHASGGFATKLPSLDGESLRVDVEAVRRNCTKAVSQEMISYRFSKFFQFGERFRILGSIMLSEDACTAIWKLAVPEPLCEELIHRHDGTVAHPAVVDAVFQVSSALLEDCTLPFPTENTYLPKSIKRVVRYDMEQDDGNDSAGCKGDTKRMDLSRPLVVVATADPTNMLRSDIKVVDELTGAVVLAFDSFEFGCLTNSSGIDSFKRYKFAWMPMCCPVSLSSINIAGMVMPRRVRVTPRAFQLADALALDYMYMYRSHLTKALSEDGDSGIHVSRRRYKRFCERALKEYTGPWLADFGVEEVTALRQEVPACCHCIDLVGSVFPQALVDSRAATAVLFADDVVTRVYDENLNPSASLEMCAEWLHKGLVAANAAGKRVIRVLEVGAGTGRLTHVLDPVLVEAAEAMGMHVEFVVTDITTGFLESALGPLKHKVVHSGILDLCNPKWNGHDVGDVHKNAFDFVVALWVVHAARDVQTAMQTIYDALVPGGHAFIIELDGSGYQERESSCGQFFFDFIFGTTREWFGMEDSLRCNPDRRWEHCTLSQLEWSNVAAACGFDTSMQTTTDEFLTLSIRKPLHCWPKTASVKAQESSDMIGGHIDRHFLFEQGREMDLVRLINELHGSEAPVRLWMTACDDCASGSIAVGLSRVLRNEHIAWTVVLLLFEATMEREAQNEWLQQFRHAVSIDPDMRLETEYRIDMADEVSVGRVVRAEENKVVQQAHTSQRNEIVWSLSLSSGSDRTSLRTVHRNLLLLPDLQPCEVQVEVHAIGMNFRDVLVDVGVLQHSLAEFAGKVTAVGSSVCRVCVGDRVMGLTTGLIGNVVVSAEKTIVRIPDNVSAEAAAALPVVFSTAWRALVQIANVKEGERVLVHSGTGGVGLAALQIAERRGALIFATVGTVTKRRFLVDKMKMDPSAISDSHNAETWTRDLLRWSPTGVDVVLNSLYGHHLRAGLKVLRPGGRFVEIGKRDFLDNTNIGLGVLADNRAFHSLELNDMNVFDCLNPVVAEHERLPFDVSYRSSVSWWEAPEAYSLLQKPDRIGKVILNGFLEDPPSHLISPVQPAKLLFDPRKSYVLVGGCGGLGAGMVRWLGEQGARHITITSRRGQATLDTIPPHISRVLQNAVTRYKLHLKVMAADAAELSEMQAVFDGLPAPLGGVFLLTLVLRDTVFLNATQADFDAVYRPKIQALTVLETVVDFQAVDFVVLFSSVSSVIGTAGQGNYAAAQNYLNCKAASLPKTISVVVPPITDVGMFSRQQQRVTKTWNDLGIPHLSCEQFCKLLDDAIRCRCPYYLCELDWRKVLRRWPFNRFGHLMERRIDSLNATDNNDGETVESLVMKLLGIDPSTSPLDPDVPLTSYGLDSIIAIPLKQKLHQNFGVQVSQMQLLGNTGIGFLQNAASDARKVNQASAKTMGPTTTAIEEALLSNVLTPLSSSTARDVSGSDHPSPLYMLPGMGADVTTLKVLAQRLRTEVIALDTSKADELDQGLMTLIEFYTDVLLEHSRRRSSSNNNNGPFRLGGFSYGGFMALLIAHQLRSRGHQVASVVVIDAGVVFASEDASVDVVAKHMLQALGDASISTQQQVYNIIDTAELSRIFGKHKELLQDTGTMNIFTEFIKSHNKSPVPLVLWIRSVVDGSELAFDVSETSVSAANLCCRPVYSPLRYLCSMLEELDCLRLHVIADTHFRLVSNPRTATIINDFYSSTSMER